MRYSMMLPFLLAPPGAGEWRACIDAIDEAGFDACAVSDHPIPKPDAPAGGHHALDPFVKLGFVAAHSRRLYLHANIVVLPYRNPFLTANTALTLQALSGERLLLGLGSGYARAEFDALGVPYDARGQLFDEYLGVMVQAWSGEPVFGSGSGWAADGNTSWIGQSGIEPPAIWLGGNGELAIQRAARYGACWSPQWLPPQMAGGITAAPIDDFKVLGQRVSELRRECERIGREQPPDLCLVNGPWMSRLEQSADQVQEEVATLQDLGFTWLSLIDVSTSLSEYVDHVWMWAELLGTNARG